MDREPAPHLSLFDGELQMQASLAVAQVERVRAEAAPVEYTLGGDAFVAKAEPPRVDVEMVDDPLFQIGGHFSRRSPSSRDRRKSVIRRRHVCSMS